MEDYKKFLESKRHKSSEHGIKPLFMPDYLFDFQKYVTEYAIKKGRSEVYSPVSMGRKAIGIELKDTYFKQMVENLKGVKDRFVSESQLTLI